MLARALAAILATAALLVVGSTSPAAAAGGENCWYETDPNTGEVKLVCEDETTDPGTDPTGPGSSVGGHEILPGDGHETARWRT